MSKSKTKRSKIVTLDYNFGGLKAGQRMLVATPQIVDDYIRAIPFGEHRTVEGMRRELARRHKCDGSCPMSTSIFVRISAETALKDMEANPEDEVAPFWRILRSDDKVAKRLNLDPGWIEDRRAAEGIKV